MDAIRLYFVKGKGITQDHEYISEYMNDFIQQPFLNYGQQQDVAENFNEPHPLSQLWALRILVDLGSSNKFIGDSCFTHHWIAKILGFSEPLLGNQYNRQQAHQELIELHQQAEQRHALHQYPLGEDLQYNLNKLQQLLGLTAEECLILGFIVFLHSEQFLDEIADTLGTLTATKTIRAMAMILNLPYEIVRQTLSAQGRLHRSGLIHIDQNYNDYLRGKLNVVSSQLVDKLLIKTNDIIDLFVGTINKSPSAELTLQDYAHFQGQLDVLLAYLQQIKQQPKTGVNIFIFGGSGTGKTQLCKVLSAALQVQLFEIACEDEDGDSITATGRLCAYKAAQSIFDGQSAFLIFDEVEDVFNDTENGAGLKSTAQSRKAWVNRMLEHNSTPTFWVSNSNDLDAAFLRRFDVVLEVNVPPKKQRAQIIQKHCADELSSIHQDALANVEQLSPAILRRAYRVAKTAKQANPELTVQQNMTTLVSSTLKAQGYTGIRMQDSNALPKFYDLDYIHTKADLSQIAQGIKQYGFGRLCLYGASGTGKTAFARWLAEYVDRPLLVKRGSDILSPWVGEMEQNLAKAFAEAEQQGAVLLLDEVDSMLQNRQQAVRSWEISQVNEFLVQMESFNGILITTTNRFDDLDQAALRRFDFKIHFDYLTYAQRWALLQHVCHELKLEVCEQDVAIPLKALNRLCAGDFAVIVRQSFFHPFHDVSMVLQHLTDEMAIKCKTSRAIGFSSEN